MDHTPQPQFQSPHQPRRRTSRAAFATSVVTASLLVGGASGLGGAAAWDAWQGEEPTSSTSPERTVSSVVDAPDQTAADGSVEQVASLVLPSVVQIDVVGAEQSGSGSGIILSSDGLILTNNHVVDYVGDDGRITVSFDDGSRAEAELLGTDPLTDTAVLQAQDVEGLTAATIGTSGDLVVGEEVVAIGSPFGLDATVTSGIVSALDRPVDVGTDGEGNSTTYPAIQTDAAINPGNSGGPLVDTDGDVVGINSSIRTASSSSSEAAGSIGLGFAIPVDEVMPIVEQMVAGETPTHARLGISVADVVGGGTEVIEGARVQEVADETAAQDAGLAPGDVVTMIDDRIVTGADSLVATIRSYRPGDTVMVTYERGGEAGTVDLELDSDQPPPA